MRDYGKDVPRFWTDATGKQRPTPTIVGRLKSKIPLHRDLRDFVLARDGHVCQLCGVTGPAFKDFKVGDVQLVADHIVSRRNGGSHHPDNLRTLCESCNARKANTIDRKGHR